METWGRWENARKGSSCGLDRIHSSDGAGNHEISFAARQLTSTTLLISLNAAFSDRHNVTNVTAEPPKEGADRPTRAVQELTGAPAIFVWGSNQA
jgi:hypothetical protein